MADWAGGIRQIELFHQFLVNMGAELLAAREHLERDITEAVPLDHDPGILLVPGTAHLQRPGLTPMSDLLDSLFRIPFQARSFPSPRCVLDSSSPA